MPINQELYRRLVSRFQHVNIVEEDVPMTALYSCDAYSGSTRLQTLCSGEYYCINCPDCNDTRKRLWINHRWGVWDAKTQSHNLYLACCYNEECFKRPQRARRFREELFSDVNDGSELYPLPPPVTEADDFMTVYWPGDLIELADLPAEHPAIQYLKERRFDPVTVAKRFGVTYCDDAKKTNMLNMEKRLIIPISFNGEVRGWQARFVGEPTGKYTPKYLTMPGLKKSRVLYNFDTARNYPFVVLAEGCTDVWRIGAFSVAMLGKTLSWAQQALVVSKWYNGAVFVLLDSDAADDAQKIVSQLKGQVRHVVVASLPPGKDPADLSPPRIRLLLREAAQKAGVLEDLDPKTRQLLANKPAVSSLTPAP